VAVIEAGANCGGRLAWSREKNVPLVDIAGVVSIVGELDFIVAASSSTSFSFPFVSIEIGAGGSVLLVVVVALGSSPLVLGAFLDASALLPSQEASLRAACTTEPKSFLAF
jgi:hypothetical protein